MNSSPLLTSIVTEREAATAKRDAQHAANLRTIAEADTKYVEWKQRFDELIPQPLMEIRGSFWDRGSDVWAEEIQDWLRLNPQPTRYVESNGGLQHIVDNTAKNGIAQATRDYADQFVEPAADTAEQMLF
jgi:hypothetical protein